jgi:hypothetical protein
MTIRLRHWRAHRRPIRFARAGRAGPNRVRARRRVSAGRYTLTAAPVDLAGNAGRSRRVRFTVSFPTTRD